MCLTISLLVAPLERASEYADLLTVMSMPRHLGHQPDRFPLVPFEADDFPN